MRALLAALAAAALACSAAQPPRPVKAVAVLGSSTAAGFGATAGNAWVDLVRAAAVKACPEVAIDSVAMSGEVTWQALPASAGAPPAGRPAQDPAHGLDAALAFKPVLVLVQFPSNDAAQRYPLEETLANHRLLRDAIRAAGATEVIVGPFPRAFGDPAQVQLMTGLRDQLPAVGAPRYLPLWQDLASTDETVIAQYAYGDGIHLNDAGHALVAAKVLASPSWAAVCGGR